MARATFNEYRFTISGSLPTLNEYSSAQRRNRYLGAKFKRDAQTIVSAHIARQLKGVHINRPVSISYKWVEKTKRRDLDNISGFGHKVIQDALVESRVLKDDGWDEIVGYRDFFQIDKNNPRIEVTITEVSND